MAIVNAKLREARLGAGMSQRELAELAGVNLSLVQKLEYGTYNIGNIAARSYIGICDALGRDPHDLLPEEKSDRRGGGYNR